MNKGTLKAHQMYKITSEVYHSPIHIVSSAQKQHIQVFFLNQELLLYCTYSIVRNIRKGAFNDYVDTILPFFDHHLPLRGHF